MSGSRDVAEGAQRRPLRRDAAENQERVLAAAVTAFMREGRQVPMSVIAAEAGVGVATLYRKYPHREALLMALTERAFSLLADMAEEVCRRGGSGLEQLSGYWDWTIAEYDQLVLPLGGGPPELTSGAERERDRLHRSQREILARGQADGSIRAGITLRDVIFFGAMLVTPVHGRLDWRSIARRQKQLHLVGLAGPRARQSQGYGPSPGIPAGDTAH